MAELPELPKLEGTCWDRLYTADQMREYARAAIQAERERCAELRSAADAYIAAFDAFRDADFMVIEYADRDKRAAFDRLRNIAAAFRGQAEGRE